MYPTSVVEVLEQAKALIARPNGFTTKKYAGTKEGIRTSVDSSNATCFCASGALRRVCGYHPAFEPSNGTWASPQLRRLHDSAYDVLQLTVTRITEKPLMTIPLYNDSHTQDEAVGLFNAAIVAASTLA